MDMESDKEMESSSTADIGMGGSVEQNQRHAYDGNVTELLVRARQLINEGKPFQALRAVVIAVKSEGGDEAVAQMVQRSREMYLNKLLANNAADQLASLFAECAIAEGQTKQSELPTTSDPRRNPGGGTSEVIGSKENSILAESGREQVVFDAHCDGSSFVCPQCGGLHSNLRQKEHLTFWCSGSTSSGAPNS